MQEKNEAKQLLEVELADLKAQASNKASYTSSLRPHLPHTLVA
jgi:hypothetical protein